MRFLGASGRVVAASAIAVFAIGSQAVAASPPHAARPVGAGGSSSYKIALTLMTYDIRDLQSDGSFEGSGRIPPWSKRAPKQARLIRGAKPDVIAIQEGSTYLAHSQKRQVDSLQRAIGSPYKLARTEIPPNQPRHFRTGDYVLYNSKTVKPVGAAGHFTVGNLKYAAYHEFASRATGSKFLFVSTHLLVGVGSSYDAKRAAEAKKLVKRTVAMAKRRNVLLFIGGDFNASSTRVGSGKVLRTSLFQDAMTVAKKRINGQYESDNENLRRPARNGVDIDHLYVLPGVKVPSAEIVLKLSNGQFNGPIPSDHNPVVAHVSYP